MAVSTCSWLNEFTINLSWEFALTDKGTPKEAPSRGLGCLEAEDGFSARA
jgi:predicted membrane-bound dolichyl-phosphate-mannose-protein mannosyltransferase